MILTGNHDLPCSQVLDRMIRTVMPELHLDGLGAGRQAEKLVPQANAERRDTDFEESLDSIDRVAAGLGVTGAIRKKDAVRGE